MLLILVENYLMVQKVFAFVMSKGSVKKRNVSNATFSRMVFMKPNHVLDLIFIRLSQISIASSTNQGQCSGTGGAIAPPTLDS